MFFKAASCIQRSATASIVLRFITLSAAVVIAQQDTWAADTTKQDQLASTAARQEALEKDVTQGALRIIQPDGTLVECPLRHTDVQADISGFIGRVKVTQTFHNPTREKIEALYVFPLPHESAVDDMTMTVGDRKIVGLIKRRAEARNIYEQALAAGQTAALLEQERPNIFTQSVGNIEPDQDVKIEISYVDVLRYDVGTYEFHFPMVVGPRYNPGAPIGEPGETPIELQGKVSPPQPNTNRVPDAARISPPVLKPGMRNGHDVSLSVRLDAGVPIQNLKSTNHRSSISHDKANQAEITLAADDNIPNKDFVLRYDVVGDKPQMALLSHTGEYSGDAKSLGNGYFMLMIQPKEDERLTKSPPREVVFLVDVSGSMSGQPIAKAAECLREMAKLCRPDKDTFQVISFNSGTEKLFEKPVPATNENVQKAVNSSLAMQGGGGTEMLKGVQAAIDEPLDPQRVRIIVMLTDGYIGNEAEIIEHVGKHCGDQVRFWCVGIGQSPNMFLVDGVAKQGGGMGKKLGLNDDANSMAQEVMTRIQRAQLANIKIDWGGLIVAETYPVKIPELWAGRPVMIYGRYRDGGNATIQVSGKVEGEAVSWPLKVELPKQETVHDVLAKVWARQKIEDLMQQSYYGGSPAVEEMVTAIALDYKLMSQYTSFVAVDAKNSAAANEPAQRPRQMLVPVPLPEGTRWEGFFGNGNELAEERLNDSFAFDGALEFKAINGRQLNRDKSSVSRRGFGGRGGSVGGGFGGGALGAATDRLRREPALSQARSYNMPTQLSSAAPAAMAGRFGVAAGAVSADAPVPIRGIVAGGGNDWTRYRRLAASEPNGPVGQSLSKLRIDSLAELSDAKEGIADIAASTNVTYQALQGDAQNNEKVATEKLAAAKKAQSDGNLALARELFMQACLLDESAANVGMGGAIATEALAALQAVQAEQQKAWVKERPELDKKLDLVLRDRSLEEAIADVARAAAINISIVPGSIDDAKSLCNRSELRVNYFDLGQATLAEALGELLSPERLNWRLAKGGVEVVTDRRESGAHGWIYDVSAIALPLAEELQKAGNPQQATAAKVDADRFSRVVRSVLKMKGDDVNVTWFAPGQLLVIGTAEEHTIVEKLLGDLTSPKPVDGVDADLRKIYAERFAKREPQIKKAAANKLIVETVDTLDFYGWKLMSAAADSRLDEEALTELEIAWRQPQTTAVLKGNSRALTLRSLWMISESARALPDNGELAAFAKKARSLATDAISESIATLKKQPDDAAAFTAVLYAALASHGDEAIVAKSLPLLVEAASKHTDFAPAATLAQALLADRQKIDRPALVKLLTNRVAGEDLTVLLAMACRRAGGETWDAFRAASPELIGGQPLAGEVVVLINRLSRGQFQLAAN
jgi:Ca-activated chloride channel homolog